MKKNIVIAIDGPSGVGKTTVSKLLAKRLGIRYVDTGAMYRAIALGALDRGIDLSDEGALKSYMENVKMEYDVSGRVIVNNKDYTDAIRSETAGAFASISSSKRPVREFLKGFQRRLGALESVVMEGRDIGTVVFPSADMKFFLEASHDVRAKRRELELKEKGISYADVAGKMKERDDRDAARLASPLIKADDAVTIDTAGITAEGVVEKMLCFLKERRLGDIRR